MKKRKITRNAHKTGKQKSKHTMWMDNKIPSLRGERWRQKGGAWFVERGVCPRAL